MIEYSVSASIMIVLIAMLTGIGDIAALIAIFGVNASMSFFGLVQEHAERPGEGNLLPFWLGCIAGAMPWVAIGIYLMSPGSEATAPGFVYGIFVSVFVFFNGFALNMWLSTAGSVRAQLPVRGIRRHLPQPYREIGARVAGVLPDACGLGSGSLAAQPHTRRHRDGTALACAAAAPEPARIRAGAPP